MTAWEGALLAFLTRVPDSMRWMLVGSAATAVRNVPIEPNDVDILVHPDSSTSELTSLAEVLVALASPDADCLSLQHFRSSTDRPWAEKGDWTFGRWFVAGVRLEVARIRSEVSPSRLLETTGRAVWATTERVGWHGIEVPVVPLEIQLATNLDRGLGDRVDAIEGHFARSHGPDASLVQRALDGVGR